MRLSRTAIAVPLALALSGVTAATSAQDASAEPDAGTTGLLPGVELVTEPVEPGVSRVVSDGVRDLTRVVEFPLTHGWAPPGEVFREHAFMGGEVVASEEGVWLRRPEGIIRLGESDALWVPVEGQQTPPFSVAPGGTPYQPYAGRVLRDGEWADVSQGFERRGVYDLDRIAFGPDGSLWVQGDNGKDGTERRQLFARRDADGWTRIKTPPVPPLWLEAERKRVSDGRQKRRKPGIDSWAAAPDGSLYVARGNDLQRFDGESWETLERPGGRIRRIEIGRDGAVWVTTQPNDREWFERRVLRVDVEGSAPSDFVASPYVEGVAAAGADGDYWFAANGDPLTSGGCGGISRVDGSTTTTFLEDLCVYSVTVGPGGSAWLEAGSWDGNYWIPDAVGPIETYVISPDAVEAT